MREWNRWFDRRSGKMDLFPGRMEFSSLSVRAGREVLLRRQWSPLSGPCHELVKRTPGKNLLEEQSCE